MVWEKKETFGRAAVNTLSGKILRAVTLKCKTWLYLLSTSFNIAKPNHEGQKQRVQQFRSTWGRKQEHYTYRL